MTRTKKVLIGLGGAIVLLVAALALVVALFDWNQLKPTINERVSAALGRPFAINGDLTVQWRRPEGEPGWRGWVPWPHIGMNDVSIGNPDWAEAPNMATLQRAEFSLSPLPLLNHHVVIRQIQLTRPAASLQRLKDGRANWVFTLPDSGEPSPWVMDIDEIGFDQGQVQFRDETLRADIEAQIDPLGKPVPFADIAGQTPADKADKADKEKKADDTEKTGNTENADSTNQAPAAPDYIFGWKVKGRYKGLPLHGAGKIGGMLAVRDPSRPFPLQADVTVGDTRIALAGTLTDPANLGALDLRLELSGATMSDLYPLTGVTLPDTPRYATDGRLSARLHEPGGAVFHYRDFNGKVGASDLHGDLTFTAGAPRPKLAGKLNSRLLRMRDLGPLVGVPPAGKSNTASKDGPKRPAGGKVLPTQEFRTDRWRVMDADVTLTAERIIYDEDLPITKLNVHLIMDNGLLTLDPLRFGMAGGTIDTTLRLDGGRTPMAGKVQIAARGLRLKRLFPKVESMQRALGQLNGDAALSGTGNSVAALLGSASGDTRLLVNDGLISRALMEIAGLNVGNYVVSKLFGDEEVKINCGAADLQMQRGVMTPRVFVFDTENALVQVDGTVSFKDETLDLDIMPKSKGVRVFSLRSPLYVRGTFGDPQAGVHVLPLAARGAGAVALGVLLTPVAGLLALVAPSAGEEDNQCATLLQQMRQPPKAPPAKGRAGGKDAGK
ncbi:AsmA family protein [Bordetella petrii]|uniref:AsmA family protein n=1 Tax=Bordetella petrii TaxID=94624 RepID=UPI001A95E3CD|nr:AsmA family protein [Bordetella petrii]MBO1112657.1 AsmA family protein [Bordetella petrii]